MTRLVAACSLALALGTGALGAGAGPEALEELLAAAERSAASDPAQSRQLAERALELARRSGGALDQSRALNRLGVALYYQGDYERALVRYSEALRLAEQLGAPDAAANALNNIGVLHYLWGSLDRALDYYERALDARRAGGVDQRGLASAYNNLGAVAHAAERFPEAIDYFGRSLAIYEQLAEPDRIASSHNNLGLAHLKLGRLEEARARFAQALALARGADLPAEVAQAEDHLGLVALAEGRGEEARGAFERALDLRRRVGDRPGTATSLLHLAAAAADLGDVDAAAASLEASLAIATELDVPQLLRDGHQELAEIQSRRGDYRDALISFGRYHDVHARMLDDAASRRLAEMRALFELEKKSAEIVQLSDQRETQRAVRTALMVVTALLGLVVVLLWSRNRLQVRARREIEAKNRELARAHAELERASRAELAHLARVASLGELAAAVAHELNQPLSAILANAQLAGSMLPSPGPDQAELEAAVQDIGLGARRAWEVLSHLRQLARRGEIERRRVDLREVLLEALDIAGAEARMRGVELVLEAPESIGDVVGDPIQLQQIVLNLVQNAIAALDDESPQRVEVRASRGGDRLRVEVADQGPPVGDEVFAGLFKPFFTTRPEGLGMGLAISKRLVEAHGGRIWARRSPTRGLTVGFDLPPARFEAEVAAAGALTGA